MFLWLFVFRLGAHWSRFCPTGTSVMASIQILRVSWAGSSKCTSYHQRDLQDLQWSPTHGRLRVSGNSHLCPSKRSCLAETQVMHMKHRRPTSWYRIQSHQRSDQVALCCHWSPRCSRPRYCLSLLWSTWIWRAPSSSYWFQLLKAWNLKHTKY